MNLKKNISGLSVLIVAITFFSLFLIPWEKWLNPTQDLVQEKTNENKGINQDNKGITSTEKNKQEQDLAFEALNTLQVSTDEIGQFYSTFPNLVQPCYPADTNFVITREEFKVFMDEFVQKHCTNLQQDIRDELVKSAVLAQEEYLVLYCAENSSIPDFENGIPLSGTWVFPNVLESRDIIIVW